MKAIIGRKIGMTQVFATDGTMYPVTVVEVLPNSVVQVKTKAHDGYDALKVGYEDEKEARLTRPEKGIFVKSGTSFKKILSEVKGDELLDKKVGDNLTVDLFKAGEVVDVIGTSKGKGFTGVIKQYHYHIGPKGHGSGYHRGSGSFANNGRCNNRVIPGKKMAGRRGHDSVTILNLVVVDVNVEKNYLLIKGAIPGPKKALVTVRSAIKTALKAAPQIKTLVNYAKEVVAPVAPTEEGVN
ncbi:MAG: 50S ribosomal protein L3 [Erysipelotrichaceae bacterium]|jgi:large subunit ribosomal protein L3|nr:50S ribosomal protein L3 [Erysipelotrichaceae bacterium]